MSKVNLKFSKSLDKITPKLDEVQRGLKQLPREAYNFFVGVTPKKSGNARRNTRLNGNVINADYPYAGKLDKGASKQAPQGMTKPTEAYIKRLLKQKLGK